MTPRLFRTMRMKRHRFRLLPALLMLTLLGGCGGYAQTSGGSGLQTYGIVDTGVVHESR